MIAISFGLCCAGFILLSLSMKRHFMQAWPRSNNFSQWSLRNRSAGYLCIAASGLVCIQVLGLWIGLVLWISEWALAAFLQALLLTYSPQRSLMFGGASVALILLGLMT
jgi:hypothetical protein